MYVRYFSQDFWNESENEILIFLYVDWMKYCIMKPADIIRSIKVIENNEGYLIIHYEKLSYEKKSILACTGGCYGAISDRFDSERRAALITATLKQTALKRSSRICGGRNRGKHEGISGISRHKQNQVHVTAWRRTQSERHIISHAAIHHPAAFSQYRAMNAMTQWCNPTRL